jgi:membrane-associated phospholipid phosphatase
LSESRLLPSALIAIVLALAFIVALDQPIARWLATRDTYPVVWNTGIDWLEYPLGIVPYKWTGVWVLTLGTIITLAIPRLRGAAFGFALIAFVHFAGRLLYPWLKLAFGRLRPTEWIKAGGGDTFWHHNAWGFPSGHAVLFGSIVVPIAVMYPRTRPLLAILVFAVTARVMVNAHFISDVLAGYAVVALLTWAFVRLLRRVPTLPIPPGCRR